MGLNVVTIFCYDRWALQEIRKECNNILRFLFSPGNVTEDVDGLRNLQARF